jgi:pimeloyl-ACP methyl ester carboxylesterase
MKKLGRVLLVLGSASLLSLTSVAFGAAGKPAIILVHGAFADGSSWQRGIPILQRDGYSVTAVQNPLMSLPDDIATTKQ